MAWRFVIHNQASEPYEEASIRNLIELKLVHAGTLAWREGLANWAPAGQIPELAGLFSAAAPASAPAAMPPIPGMPPPAGVPAPPAPGAAAGLWEERARRFVYWCFRPRNGRPSKIRAFVDEKPGRAIPVAAAILAALVLSFALFANSFSRTSAQAGGGNGGGAPMAGGGGGNTMENWYIARDAQRYNQNVIDDVYRNNRDSFDRQSETYRRANYDWYNGNNNNDN